MDKGIEPHNGLLMLCPEKRLTAAEALQSKWDVNMIPGVLFSLRNCPTATAGPGLH